MLRGGSGGSWCCWACRGKGRGRVKASGTAWKGSAWCPSHLPPPPPLSRQRSPGTLGLVCVYVCVWGVCVCGE